MSSVSTTLSPVTIFFFPPLLEPVWIILVVESSFFLRLACTSFSADGSRFVFAHRMQVDRTSLTRLSARRVKLLIMARLGFFGDVVIVDVGPPRSFGRQFSDVPSALLAVRGPLSSKNADRKGSLATELSGEVQEPCDGEVEEVLPPIATASLMMLSEVQKVESVRTFCTNQDNGWSGKPSFKYGGPESFAGLCKTLRPLLLPPPFTDLGSLRSSLATLEEEEEEEETAAAGRSPLLVERTEAMAMGGLLGRGVVTPIPDEDETIPHDCSTEGEEDGGRIIG